jgi:hypothetical protein
MNFDNFLMILIVVVLFYHVYFNNYKLNKNLKLVKNNIFVQNNENFNTSSSILLQVFNNMLLLRNELYKNKENYKDYKIYIENLYNNFNENTIIKENYNESNYTSYTVNKGEEMVFCIRSRKTNTFHDINLIMYVAIHELGHIACPEIGHTALYNDIFSFLLKKAIELNIYKMDNYAVNPVEYCGMEVYSNILS